MLKKIKNTESPTISGDWFFMSSNNVTTRMLYDALKDKLSLPIDIWEEANVMEIELSSKESMDFEQLKPYFKDDFGTSFLREHNINTLFMITFPPSYYDTVHNIMKIILSSVDGFFCSDSEDFTPMVK